MFLLQFTPVSVETIMFLAYTGIDNESTKKASLKC